MAMKCTQYKLTTTVAAGATSATASLGKAIRGRILAIRLIFSNTTPASTSDRDIDIYEMNPFDPDDTTDAIQHILDVGTLGAAPADDNGVYYPRAVAQDYQGTDKVFLSTDTANIPTEFVVFGDIFMSISNAAAGDITTAYIIVEEY